jgi:hypothetical protein
MQNDDVKQQRDERNSQPPEPLYSSLLSVRNTELTVYWTRYNIQAVLNFGLIAVALSAAPNSIIDKFPTLVAVSGMFLALIWLLFVVFSKRLITDEWDNCVKNYEQSILKSKQDVPNDILIISQFTYNKNYFKRNLYNLNFVACSLPIICGLAWYLFLLQKTQITCCSLLWKIGLGIFFGVVMSYLVRTLTKNTK